MRKRKGFSYRPTYRTAGTLTDKQKRIIVISAIALAVCLVTLVLCLTLGAGGCGGGVLPGGSGGQGGQGGSGGGQGGGAQELTVTGFYIAKAPNDILYDKGDVFDPTGLELCVNYAGTSGRYVKYDDDPDAFTFSGFDSEAEPGEQTVTVTYAGFTDTFEIILQAPPPPVAHLVGISLSPAPRLTYTLGEDIDLTDAYILCEYDDGTTKSVRLRIQDLAGLGKMQQVGEHVITVKYFDDNQGYAETTFTVTVTAPAE